MIRLCIAGVIWVALLWCTLKFCDLSILSIHSVCGVWGGGPPTTALLACHLGWLVFLAPMNPLAPWYFRNCRVDLRIAARIPVGNLRRRDLCDRHASILDVAS